jgi:branched-chain amino acid transport system substrate-binding protein
VSRAAGWAPALLLLLPLLVAAAILAPVAPSAPVAPVCERPSIGFMAPLTGPAAFVGKEQLGFARYAVRGFGRKAVRLVEADTQLQPARAAAVARRLHGDPRVLAVVGPAASPEVLAVAPEFGRRERLSFVSASALDAALTNGSIRSFFRVVPNEDAQPAAVTRAIGSVVGARRVVVVDDRSAYSRALAARVEARLKAGGVAVQRRSVSQRTTDFSQLLATFGSGIDAVFLPWQVAANAQLLGQQLRRRGIDAVLVGSDALDSGDFTVAGSYVTSFAPDVRAIAGNAGFLAGYGARFVSKFGPAAYVATQAAIAAVRRACADGSASRAEVERELRATLIRRTVLGRSLRFTRNGDAKGARFSIFRIDADGRKVMVG